MHSDEDEDLEGSTTYNTKAVGSRLSDITKPLDKSKHRDSLSQTLIVDLSVDSSTKCQAFDRMETGEKKFPKWQPGKSKPTSQLQQAWVVHSVWASIENVCIILSNVLVNKPQCEHIVDHFKVIADVLTKLGLGKDFVSNEALEGGSSIQSNLTFDEAHFSHIVKSFEKRFFTMKKSNHEVDFRTQILDVSSMFEDYVRELDALGGSNEESLSKQSKFTEGFQDYSWLRGMVMKESVEERSHNRIQHVLDEFLDLLLGVLKQGEDIVLFHSGLKRANNVVVERTGLYGEKFIQIHELLYKLFDFYACLELCEGTEFAQGYLSRRDSCRAWSLLSYLNSNCLGENASLSIEFDFLNIIQATTLSKMLERRNCTLKTLFIEGPSVVENDQVKRGMCRFMVIVALSKCVSITSLIVNGLNGEDLHELCRSLSVNKVLENLVISSDGPLADSNAMDLSKMMKLNRGLKNFTLEFGQISHKGILDLGSMLVENSSLEAMYLRYKALDKIYLKDLMRPLMDNNVGDPDVIIFLNGRCSFFKLWGLPKEESMIVTQLFRKNRTLTHFFIEFRNLEANGACEILDSLKKNKTLQVLDLQGCSNFNNNFEVAACLEAMLAENSTLEELKVDLRMWDGFCLKHLLRPLMANKDGEPHVNISVRRLHILNYNCSRDLNVIESIAQILCTNKMLSHLSMNNALLNTSDVYDILDSLKINKALQVLNLQECKGLDDIQLKVAFMDLLVNYNFSLRTIQILGRDWDIEAFMNLLVNYNFSLSMKRMHRRDWDIESFYEEELKHPFQSEDLWSKVGGTLESSIVSNAHDLKQAIGTFHLEEGEGGEGSTKQVSRSFERTFDNYSLEVEAKDERPRLFLSYSNEMRDFAMQLGMKLKSSNYNILDQDSINFVEAMDQCQLAIVVISNMYVNSQSSMCELDTIVKSKKTNNPTLKVYPLFYKLTLEDLENVYVATSIIGGEGKASLKFLLEGKNEVSRKTNDLVHNLRQSRVDVGKFCEKFCEVMRSSWPQNGMEFNKNAIFEKGSLCAVLEEIFHYMPVMKECNSDQILRHQGELEMESALSLRQLKSMLESSLTMDFYLQRKLNMGQYLQEKYIQYSSFEEMCPLYLNPNEKHEYSKGRITAALFPKSFLYHFMAQVVQGPDNGNFLPMLKAIANLVVQKMQQKCNENGIQPLMFFDFVDSGAPCDPRRTIAMCQNFSTQTLDGFKQLVIVQDSLTGVYYYQCDEASNLGNLTTNESIGVIGVQVTSTEIYIDNIHEDGSYYSGVLGDFSYKFDFDKNKHCAAKAFGDLEGARFLSKNSGIKCSPLLVIALANAIQRKGLTLTWSNGKGHMEFNPKLALKVKVELEAYACQIQYSHNINQLGVEIEWGTSTNSCPSHIQTFLRGTNEIVNQQVLQSNVDQNVVTTSSKNVGTSDVDCVSNIQNQIAIYNATAQNKSKHSLGIKAVGSGVDIGYERHDSKAKQIMKIMSKNILQRHYESEGGFDRIPNLDVEYPNLENLLCKCQLHEVHDCNYLVVYNLLASHVSVYRTIEQNEVVPKLMWITDILIEGGEDEIKHIFETGLKGRELIVKRDGSNFTQLGNPSKPLAMIVPGYQESLLKVKSRFPSNAINSSMIQISEPNLVDRLKSKNEWVHIIGPQGRYGLSHKYWWNATFMQAMVYSRTMYKSGKLLTTHTELPFNVIGHIGYCSIEKDPKNKFEHLCASMVSRGKFSRPLGSLLSNKVLWGGLEIGPEELEHDVHALVGNSSSTSFY